MVAFKSQILLQSYIGRSVPRGYRWWATNKVKSKAELDALHAKYDEIFGVDFSPAKRAYRRKQGLANTIFLSAKLPSGELDGGYVYFLLATDGKGEIRKYKNLRDAWNDKQRLVFGDYVLHQTSRHRLEGGGLRWSWHVLPSIKKELEYYIGECLKKNPLELRAFFEAQLRRPLHHGVRHYMTRLLRRTHQSFSKMYPGKAWPARDPALALPFINGFKSHKSDDE